MIKNAMFKAVLAIVVLCAFNSCGERIEQTAYRVCAFVWPSCHDDSLAREYLWKEGIGEWEVIKRGDTPRFPAKGEDDVVLYHRTPEAFQHFLEGAKEYADKHDDQPAFVYINAWNEWIEDAYLLPDICYGYGYLDAVKNVFGPCKKRPE